MEIKKSMFDTGEPNKRISDIISIESPAAFRRSVKELKRGNFTLRERKALTLAQNRARASLIRKNLSDKERKQMRSIANIRW